MLLNMQCIPFALCCDDVDYFKKGRPFPVPVTSKTCRTRQHGKPILAHDFRLKSSCHCIIISEGRHESSSVIYGARSIMSSVKHVRHAGGTTKLQDKTYVHYTLSEQKQKTKVHRFTNNLQGLQKVMVKYFSWIDELDYLKWRLYQFTCITK